MTTEQTILWLLDDNLMSSMRVQNALTALNYRVALARSRAQSEQWLQADDKESPALILINLGSRPLDGVSLIKPYRAKFPNARILGFCGHLETEIRRAARAAGIDALLTNEEAFSGLQTALGRSASRSAAQ